MELDQEIEKRKRKPQNELYLGLYVNAAQKRKIQYYRQKTGLSQSELVRLALDDFLIEAAKKIDGKEK